MIRTLATIAGISFILAVACMAGAFAIAGGPFSIDDAWRFHRETPPIESTSLPSVSRATVQHSV